MSDKYMPEWAKRLEAWGRDMEKKYGSSRPGSDNNEEDWRACACSDRKKKEWQRDNHPVGDMFGQLISYLVLTYVPSYFPEFFLAGWSAVYIVAVYAILVHVGVDLALIILNARPFYYIGKVTTNVASIVSMVVMVTIFPFNFPGNVGAIVQFGFWIAITVVAIVTFFEFFKIFGSE